jgi:hypothetical protein
MPVFPDSLFTDYKISFTVLTNQLLALKVIIFYTIQCLRGVYVSICGATKANIQVPPE